MNTPNPNPTDLVRELRKRHTRDGREDPDYYCGFCSYVYDYESDPDGENTRWPCVHIRAADELERERAISERLRIEAQVHAQEARTQRATVHACYQAATGSTGEPGDWNGARPVAEIISRLRADLERYHELIYAVGSVHPGQTRHETALMYIQRAENRVEQLAAIAAERENHSGD